MRPNLTPPDQSPARESTYHYFTPTGKEEYKVTFPRAPLHPNSKEKRLEPKRKKKKNQSESARIEKGDRNPLCSVDHFFNCKKRIFQGTVYIKPVRLGCSSKERNIKDKRKIRTEKGTAEEWLSS